VTGNFWEKGPSLYESRGKLFEKVSVLIRAPQQTIRKSVRP
jgi:hypothetical protein